MHRSGATPCPTLVLSDTTQSAILCPCCRRVLRLASSLDSADMAPRQNPADGSRSCYPPWQQPQQPGTQEPPQAAPPDRGEPTPRGAPAQPGAMLRLTQQRRARAAANRPTPRDLLADARAAAAEQPASPHTLAASGTATTVRPAPCSDRPACCRSHASHAGEATRRTCCFLLLDCTWDMHWWCPQLSSVLAGNSLQRPWCSLRV